MNKDIFIFEISILVTGVTMFMIFNKVKKINFDFVDSIAKKNISRLIIVDQM
jgi:hypothetical protein